MAPSEALEILRSTPTTAISKAVPIESVVRTRLESILEKVVNLAALKVKSGDSFAVRCDVRGRRYIKSKENLINKISDKLVEKLDLSPNGRDPDWIVQVEVVDENTGVSVLKPHEILKKI
jgi:tRNA acetyltransferase TAN1